MGRPETSMTIADHINSLARAVIENDVTDEEFLVVAPESEQEISIRISSRPMTPTKKRMVVLGSQYNPYARDHRVTVPPGARITVACTFTSTWENNIWIRADADDAVFATWNNQNHIYDSPNPWTWTN